MLFYRNSKYFFKRDKIMIEAFIAMATLTILYGVSWALFSAVGTDFNITWGTPEESWANTGVHGPYVVETSALDDGWVMPNKPVGKKVTPSEEKKTQSYENLTDEDAENLRRHMREFREKKLAEIRFTGSETIVDENPYGLSYWEDNAITIQRDRPAPKGKVGNR
jgi:hypothetical protein